MSPSPVERERPEPPDGWPVVRLTRAEISTQLMSHTDNATMAYHPESAPNALSPSEAWHVLAALDGNDYCRDKLAVDGVLDRLKAAAEREETSR